MIVICISQIIGKQPDSDVWVFNADVQMDGSENLTPLEQRKFISEGKRNDHVVKIPSDFDSGEFRALKNLFKAEKALSGTTSPQVLMAHMASSLCANFDLAIDLFDGCAILVHLFIMGIHGKKWRCSTTTSKNKGRRWKKWCPQTDCSYLGAYLPQHLRNKNGMHRDSKACKTSLKVAKRYLQHAGS